MAAIDFIGRDPAHPWPGVQRDAAAAAAGRTGMCRDRSCVELLHDVSTWPTEGSFDIAFAPLGLLAGTADVERSLDRLTNQVRSGGLLVTEEPARGNASVVEPLLVDLEQVRIAALTPIAAGYLAAITTFSGDRQHTSTTEIVVPSSAAIDNSLAQRGWVLVGRWADWSGALADGASWHVAVHRLG